jgi:hypothetical protein
MNCEPAHGFDGLRDAAWTGAYLSIATLLLLNSKRDT